MEAAPGSVPELRRSFWQLCTVIFFVFLGNAMVNPLVPLFALELGASPALLGVVISAAFLIPLFLALPAGALVDRYGWRGLLLTGTVLLALAPILVVLLPGFATLVLLQVMVGLGQLLAVVSAQSFVAALGSGRMRERNFGWYGTFISGAHLVGPLLAGLLVDHFSFATAFAVAGFAAAFAIPLVLGIRGPAAGVQGAAAPLLPSPARLATLLKSPGLRISLLLSPTLLLLAMTFDSFMPAYLDLLEYPASIIGAIISLRALATILVRPFMEWSVRFLGGRLRTMVVTGLVAALGLIAVAFGDGLALLALVAVMVGVGFGLSQPITMVTAVAGVDPSSRGSAFGLRLTANRLSQVVGPLTLGAIADNIGFRLMFPLAAVIATGPLIYVFLKRRSFSAAEEPDS